MHRLLMLLGLSAASIAMAVAQPSYSSTKAGSFLDRIGIQSLLWDDPYDGFDYDVASQVFPDYPEFSIFQFDDFTVDGCAWRIRKITAYGNELGNAANNQAVRVRIQERANFEDPGTVYLDAGGIEMGENVASLLVFDNLNLLLPAGQYFMTVYVVRDYNSGLQWFWWRNTPVQKSQHIFHNPGNGFGFGSSPQDGSQIFGWEADMSFTIEGDHAFIIGDATGDCCVDDDDLSLVLENFGSQCTDCPADINGDGVVDDTDLALVLERFGDGCDD